MRGFFIHALIFFTLLPSLGLKIHGTFIFVLYFFLALGYKQGSDGYVLKLTLT